MNSSGSSSRFVPWLVGGLVGLVLGLIFGLFYAYNINPVFYTDGAFPNELTAEFQQSYVGAVAEAYMTTGDVTTARNRLRTFSVQEKVKWLATVEAQFRNNGQITEATKVAELASAMNAQENWPPDQVSAGLQAGNASPEFAEALGMAAQPTPADGEPQPQPPAEPAGQGTSSTGLLIGFLVILLIAAIVGLLLYRMRSPKQPAAAPFTPDPAMDDSGMQPLRQWVGTYTFGQDNYDESFTVETAESDFLGECGMGILEGFAAGTPRRVMAFDVWLFDKTDIRTVSMPIMSNYAFEAEDLRAKLSPDATPVLATEGQSFDIETTALLVKATIEEVEYGEEQPPMGYFSKLKVSLTAYLKPDVDVSGSMPIPEGYN